MISSSLMRCFKGVSRELYIPMGAALRFVLVRMAMA